MNKTISDLARKQILEGLLRLPEGHQDLFRRMYRWDLPEDATLQKIVGMLPSEKLDWALSQVEYSHAKLKRKASGIQHGDGNERT